VVDLRRFEWCRNEIKHSISILQTDKANSTRKEFEDAIDMFRELKVRVWKTFKLEEAEEALQALFAKERDGIWHMT
jgi:D-arabinose 1-dehydrogenase-like Zn-dependent alcohol dehydrogenase